MKKRLQGLIAGILIGVIMTSGFSFAKQLIKKAELVYSDIKISLNGEEIQPKDAFGEPVEPFAVDGTTYLPVRAVANALGLKVDWDTKTNTVLLDDGVYRKPKDEFDAKKVASEIEVLEEHTWKSSVDYYFVAIVFKNTSDYLISPEINVVFRDEKGEAVGTGVATEEAVGPNSKMAFVLSNDVPFATYEYTLTAEECIIYGECASKIECNLKTVSDKFILEVKNNGKEAAKFVQYTMLLKKDGKVVDYKWGYCTDEDNELKPGAAIVKEVNYYTPAIDTIDIYFNSKTYLLD